MSTSLVHLERIDLRLSPDATLVSLNHNLSILCYTYYSSTRKVHYVVIESSTPIRLCFRKKVTSLNWIFIDNRDILITSFESGYIGCFDVNGRLLFKQQIDSKPILNIYIASSHRDRDREDLYAENIDVLNENIPNLFCLTPTGVILINSYDLYSTLKYSNFDISLLSKQEKKEYFEQIKRDKQRQENKLKQHKYPKYARLKIKRRDPQSRKFKTNINDDLLPSTYRKYRQQQEENENAVIMINDLHTKQVQNGCAANNEKEEEKKHSNRIPITTILPLRPICNQVLYWKANKILIPENQKIACFAAYFFPKSKRKKTESELLQNGHTRSASMKYNYSAHSIQNLKYEMHQNRRRLSRSQSMYQLNHNYHHHQALSAINNEHKEKEKERKEENDCRDLLNPKIAFKQNTNDADDEWLIVLCGSNPMCSTVHIQIEHAAKKKKIDNNKKLNKKSTQKMMKHWLSAAKSLFVARQKSMSSSSLLSSATSFASESEKKEVENECLSPSKSQRMNIEIINNEYFSIKKKKKKKQNRSEIAQHQKEFQHRIRDMKYNKYGVQFSYCASFTSAISITSIVMSPSSEYGAFTDCFGRIWIWQSKQCKFVRVFKGYRRAQIGWRYINNDIDKLCINNKFTSIPRYIYRRSRLLLILYISSRGLLEFHLIECHKRIYAVNIFCDALMIYHLNYSVSPPWSNILFHCDEKIYKLQIKSSIIKSSLLNSTRQINEYWNTNNMNHIRLLSETEFIANIDASCGATAANIFGTQCISLYDANIDIIQWFILISQCSGDICCGLQCVNKNELDTVVQKADCFANYFNGWGFHCDGFIKHNGSYTGYGWKYGKYDTIGIILNVNHKDVPTLQFTLNGKLCKQINNQQTKITLPSSADLYRGHNHYVYRLAVSVSINSCAQCAIIAFSK